MPQEEKAQVLAELMANLKNYVGKKIIVIYWTSGVLHGLKGELQDVIPFDYINLEGQKIDFLGLDTAIQCIAVNDTICLYYNHQVENYQGFSLKDIASLIHAQEEILGHSAKRDEINTLEDKPRGI